MSADLTPVVGRYGHGGIKLTAYPSSGRISVVVTAENAVMDWWELFGFVDQIRKPHTITTEDELRALPGGSVVRDDNGRLWEVQTIGYGGVDKALAAMGVGSMLAYESFRQYPGTVLHEGDA